MSMKPGARTSPLASTTRPAPSASNSPTTTIASSRTATDAVRRGAPVPSIRVAFEKIRS
jgi:hypothetical protein